MLLSNIIAPETPEDRTQAVESLSGPIGIGNLFVNMVASSVPVSTILILMAVISVNLAVFNLLPIPALDGGRAVFIIVREGVVRLFPRLSGSGLAIEGYIHLAGFAILIVLSIVVAYHDIAKILF